MTIHTSNVPLIFYYYSPDCKSSTTGREYSGVLSTTKADLTCQRWDAQTPHAHTMTDPNRFPDNDLASASNYCRNPNNDPEGPWCYTTDEFVEKDYCDIDACTGNYALKAY